MFSSLDVTSLLYTEDIIITETILTSGPKDSVWDLKIDESYFFHGGSILGTVVLKDLLRTPKRGNRSTQKQTKEEIVILNPISPDF